VTRLYAETLDSIGIAPKKRLVHLSYIFKDVSTKRLPGDEAALFTTPTQRTGVQWPLHQCPHVSITRCQAGHSASQYQAVCIGRTTGEDVDYLTCSESEITTNRCLEQEVCADLQLQVPTVLRALSEKTLIPAKNLEIALRIRENGKSLQDICDLCEVRMASL
jgi:hypothetical protein